MGYFIIIVFSTILIFYSLGLWYGLKITIGEKDKGLFMTFSINPLKKIFAKAEYEYGILNGQHARRHIKNGNVQYVLWRKGEVGHEESFWYDSDPSWWDKFEIKK